jgi:DNA-binding CsgD family transcriptional regulator
MHVPLETPRRAAQLLDSLADADRPDRLAEFVLPGLAGLVRCDVMTYNEIGPGPGPGVLPRLPVRGPGFGQPRGVHGPRARAPSGQLLPDSPGSGRLAGLTDREFQVLQFAAQGCTNRAIARTMGVSPRTIAKHLEHTYRKLGVTSRAAAVYAATTGPAQATLDAAEETWSLPAASHSVK